RELGEKRRDRGIDRNGDGAARVSGVGQDAAAGVVVGDDRADGPAEALDERFIAGKEKQPIFLQRSAERRAKLVAVEVGLGLRVEEVARVERVVAVIL